AEYVDFTWWVPANGYVWRDAIAGERQHWVLVPNAGSGPGWRGRRYAPLQEHSGLFREFAATETSPEGLLGFANRYGTLFGEHGRPEPLHRWQVEVLRLRQVISLWDLLCADDREGLRRHIVWDVTPEGEPAVYFDPYPGATDPDSTFAVLGPGGSR